MMYQPPSVAEIRWGDVLMLALGGAILAGAAVLWLSWQISPPPGPLSIHLKGLFFKFVLGDFLHIETDTGAAYRDWLQQGGAALVLPRALIALAVGSITGIFLLVKLAKPKESLIHIAGRRLLKETDATSSLATQAKFECKSSGEGIKLHPSFPFKLSLDRETKHFLVAGSIGGGKTQVILPMMIAAQARGDRMVVHDTKGDFTAGLPGNPAIIAPWDARSFAWDVAADCQTKQDARELAARLVPESKDPMWAFAARQILVGFLTFLQKEKGQTWGWQDLADLIPLPQQELLSLMSRYNPEGVRAVEDASKTTQSILITLSSYMSVVFDLAEAWGNTPKEKRISFVAWLLDENHPNKTLIMQNSGRFSTLSRSYISGVIALLSSRINSPDFSDSKTRRIWFFLDEFPQLGKMESFAPLLEVGRSKGVRVVIGLQDMAQVRKLYGRDDAQSWASMVGTQIFARINPGETADWVADLVGKRIVERPNLSSSGRHGGDGQTVSRSYSRETLPVILPSQLQDELGKTSTGNKCLVLGYRNANILLWPFTTTAKIRPVSQLAEWVNDGRSHTLDETTESVMEEQPQRVADSLVIASHEETPTSVATEQIEEIPTLATRPAPILATASESEPDQLTQNETPETDDTTLSALASMVTGEPEAIPKKRRIVRKKTETGEAY